MFKSMGHENIAVLNGGLPEWIANSFETEKIKNKELKEGSFKAIFYPEFQKSAFEILTNIENQKSVVVDARSYERFYGLKPETRENLKSGHIPNSINLPFLEVLKDGKFLPKYEISAIFKRLELENKSLIFTCGSGLTACILILASELIKNKNNYLYDGSWTEWGQLERVPIEK